MSFSDQYRDIFHSLKGDVAGRLVAQQYLNTSTAIYRGNVIGMGFIPQIYTEFEVHFFDKLAASTYRILEAMTERFCTDAAYRSLFGFSPLLEYLLLLPCGYETTLPIARIDIFYDPNSQRFMFCEFNTDGSSAMNEDREICNALALSATFTKATEIMHLQAQELFDPWVETFAEIYQSSKHAKSTYAKETGAATNPTIAIVDYMDKTTINELMEFRHRFEEQGFSCLICDVRDLVYQDGILHGTDIDPQHPTHHTPTRLDAIYRRAVTSDIVEDLTQTIPHEQLSPKLLDSVCDTRGTLALIAAARDGAVCLIGGFKTQVVHSKTAFRMLHHPETLAFLSEEQRQFIKDHVPFTTELRDESIAAHAVLTNKDAWIIKPIDGYGSKGVWPGKSYSFDEWASLVKDAAHKGYVLQEYCEQYPVPNTVPIPVELNKEPTFSSLEEAEPLTRDTRFVPQELKPYNTLTGLFIYGGKFRGIYVRAGMDALIVGFRGGITLGTFIANEHQDELPVRLREM